MTDAPDFASAPPAEGYETLSDFAIAVARLAELPPHEYERRRKAEAKELGVRVSMLDQAVKSARAEDAGDEGQGKPIVLPEVEPWPDPVDGAQLIGDLVAQIRRFIVLPEASALTVALWAIFAHAHEAAFHSPRLALRSPVHRCGKSTLIRVIGMLAVRKVAASSVTASAMFRLISAAGGLVVLLIDEFDQVGDQEKAGELIAVVNAGHCRLDAYVIRTVPVAGDLKARRFDCWAPCVVASNKALPVTWTDRSVVLRLARKGRGDRVERLRDDLDLGFDALASRAARWAADNLDALRGADPALPGGLNDRQCDNWRMLAAIADRAGGDWGRQARTAAVELSLAEHGDSQARGELLLQDLRTYFAENDLDRAPSMHLVAHLNDLEGRPWAEHHSGRPLSQNQLANLLKPFGIAPGTIRMPPIPPATTGTTPRGYMRDAFEAAWSRYLSQDPPSQTATTPQATESARHKAPRTATSESGVADRDPLKATATVTCGVVADQNPPPREKPNGGGTAEPGGRSANGPLRLKAGDRVQWAPGGVDQLPGGAVVTRLSDCGGFVFIEGSGTGLPVTEISVVAEGRPPDPPAPKARVVPMITAAQRAKLLKHGVHPEVVQELRPQDVQNLLGGEPVLVPTNAERAPEQDLADLRVCLNGPGAAKSSATWSAEAQRYVTKGDTVTAAMIDQIKNGAGIDAAPYWLRDALWVALS